MPVPKGPKQPEDHKPKTDETPDPEPRVVTVHGAEYTVDPAAFDDFELMDDLERLGRPNGITRLPSILRSLLGDVQMTAALESLRDPDTGRVPLDTADSFVGDLLEALNPN